MSTPVGPEPSNVICTACNKQVTTSVTYVSSTKTHLIALLLCVLGCCPCACCLYCTKCCRNVEHRCPSCNTFLGIYER
ncbi:lipopolysaccharide-induced tumor necrosis factor-alpha factor homolog [Zeugodacus cucurbitae]|uniref:lipopolysaccharide-induced tumor necrosis factor-alpha factor homolog n=1 Tax=Zeugodacus cucurbitae TaxID=28588 RepID=UPI0023D8E637|nr:lipopolysaccharide-induced tumor necrosis factor-alpha factor homolog [Zeugodacus cucurbitae]XP_028894644.2 lipopolysaccharide-induced tumor necrosis factor-alpha factor homolog [Zeugodacus cucurbitae]